MCAWPYPAVETVPSSTTAATGELSDAQVTPVAGPITTPASSAKLAFNAYRRLSGRPSRAAEIFRPAAMTRICHVTTRPGPGPLTTSVVFPARFPVSVPDDGSKLASDVSPTVQRNGASGTGLLSAVSACTWNFAVPWMGSGSSVFDVGRTVSAATVLCTRMSTAFVCSNPTTLSVVRPGATVVSECTRHHARILGRQEVHGGRLDPEDRGRSAADDLTGEGINAGGIWRRRLTTCRLRGCSGGGRGARGGAHHLNRSLALARAGPGLDDRHSATHARDRPVVVHPRHRDVIGRPDEPHAGDDIPGAVERGGKQPAPLPDSDCDRGGGHLDFSDILCRHRARMGQNGEEDDVPSRHSGA